MPDYLPRYKPGHTPNIQLAGTVTGGLLLEVAGSNLAQIAAAGSTKVIGVASVDGKAGDTIGYHRDGVQRLVAAGVINAGDKVQAAANGQVATGTTAPIGTALQAAAKAGDVIDVAWA